MPSDGTQRDLGASFFARLGAATRYAVTGDAPDSWFGPQKPIEPVAPPDVKGRRFDYPFGVNLSYTPRVDATLSFAELRALADALPLLRLLIETRKDQIAGLNYTVRARDPKRAGVASPRIATTLAFLARPDRRLPFSAWLRMWLEDMLVIDAATLYPRYTRGGDLYAVDVIDGSTIAPMLADDGRTPEPPDPAYQQVLHGVPAADFSANEILYLPRNPRPQKLYGMSPVEQVAMTVNIALRRDMATLDYYRLGSTPDSFATLPKDWTLDQIRQFQDYFDALMSGNSARRRMVKFMPSDFKLTETRQPPLKDQYDEWLARVICYAFSIPPSPFVSQVNRATSETMRTQATQEGLVPLKAFVKGVLDQIVQGCLKQPDLEFVWVGDDAIDPLQQAQTLSILVGAGIKTREEARADLGLTPEQNGKPSAGESVATADIAKFNPYHDERGRFTTSDWSGEGSQPAIPVSGSNSSKYTIDLSEEEKHGGHAIKEHVDLTDRELLISAGTPVYMSPFGTEIYQAQGRFVSLSDANNFVNRVLEQNRSAVDTVAAGTSSKAWLEVRFGYPTGTEALVTDQTGIPRLRATYNVGVAIVHDATRPNGYTVRTAYPLNNYPGELRL